LQLLYREVVEFYERVEATTKRLEITALLVDMLRHSSCDEVANVVYMTHGKLFADFYPEKIGMAEKMALRTLASVSRADSARVEKLYREKGDIGLVGEELIRTSMKSRLAERKLTVNEVHDKLLKITTVAGEGSQDEKVRLLSELLASSTPAEAKYILRIVVGKMRLGVAAMTLIDALAATYAEKESSDAVERAYNITSDLGKVAESLCREGMKGLSHLKLQLNVPIRCMLAERLPGIRQILEKMGGRAAFDYKYDGLRMQAHVKKGKVKLFSRQLEDLTDQFPEIAEAVGKAYGGEEGIVEGECVPVDSNTGEILPFQVVSRRRGRKHEVERAVEEYPVTLFLFDLLYSEGKDYTSQAYPVRRKELETRIREGERVRLSTVLITSSVEKGERFFNQAIEAGCEGVVAKSVAEDSVYQAGARGWLWIKYKREYRSEMTDTVDLVVVGAFSGRGRRSGTYGALLMASYNRDRDMFETVSKLGSGFDDQMLAELPHMLKEFRVDSKPENVDSKLIPDFWFRPQLVLEVLGAEITHSPVHTCCWNCIKENAGLAIRFPRFTGRVRDDKGPYDATTTPELLNMYRTQLKKTK